MIIGLSGYAGTGKDTVAAFIQELRPEFVNKKFAGPLKKIASILTGIPEEKFEDREFKDSCLDAEWSKYEFLAGNGEIYSIGIYSDIPKRDLFGRRERKITVREFLQRLGTEAIRNNLHQNAWVNALMAEYKLIDYEYPNKSNFTEVYPNWIISDVRMFNEAQAIKDHGGVIIRIDRPGFGPINNHPSETELDNWNFDYKILNASDLVSLKATVEVVLNKIL